MEYCVVSIGALSHNRLWGEAAAVRTGHSTTTLIRDAKRVILVDPSLPSPALDARFNERTGLMLKDVTDVFCTTLRPIHRRGIGAVGGANWWAAEQELESYRAKLTSLLGSAQRLGEEDIEVIQADLKLMDRFKPAPEKFTEQVQLYPLRGASAGSAGLLLTTASSCVVVAGDAALTAEHVLRGQVWEGCEDTDAAMESLRDMLELADVIIPGHDNVMFCPQRWL